MEIVAVHPQAYADLCKQAEINLYQSTTLPALLEKLIDEYPMGELAQAALYLAQQQQQLSDDLFNAVHSLEVVC